MPARVDVQVSLCVSLNVYDSLDLVVAADTCGVPDCSAILKFDDEAVTHSSTAVLDFPHAVEESLKDLNLLLCDRLLVFPNVHGVNKPPG